jgi:2-polyprenyl-3-methyl-5-hydroxy-6-metoxy-1,4-benzoquinol methylase
MMANFTETDADRVYKDKDEFNARHKDSLWQEYVHTPSQIRAFETMARFLINTQNGSDVDDYTIADGSRIVTQICPHVGGKDVLILGTGTGREMKVVREHGAKRVDGITLGSRNKKFAQEVVGENPIICDIHMMPYQQSEFDFVVGLHVFEHSYAPLMFLLECNRVLRTGGKLFLETPDPKTNSGDSWFHHVICPTPRQLFAMLLKTGYKPARLVLGSTEKDISKCATERDLPDEWADTVDVFIYMEAIKMDPMSYQRGDMSRYYRMLDGSPFVR